MDTKAENIETAVVVREQGGAIDRALTVDELKQRLEFVQQVMGTVMREGQDYGKVPGCGDKPGLFQPGAQKLGMTFQLTDEVKSEKVVDHPNFHREYSFIVSVKSSSGRTWDGVGTCSTMEAKYRYKSASLKCPLCGKESVFKSKKPGEGWYCWAKKGGCGAQFPPDAESIKSQNPGRVEHDNPPDFWNTVRKMAFKRGFVHAMINATNTSELWSQDLEDIAANQGAVDAEVVPEPPKEERHIVFKVSKTGPTLKDRIAKLTTMLGAAKVPYAIGYLRSFTVDGSDANASLMPNEDLSSLGESAVDWLAHHWQEFVDRLDAYIASQDQIPGAEAPDAAEAPQPDAEEPIGPTEHSITGFVKTTNSKETKKAGKFRYGICVSEDMHSNGIFLNTFSVSDYDLARGMHGKKVACTYTEGKYGKELLSIQEAA